MAGLIAGGICGGLLLTSLFGFFLWRKSKISKVTPVVCSDSSGNVPSMVAFPAAESDAATVAGLSAHENNGNTVINVVDGIERTEPASTPGVEVLEDIQENDNPAGKTET